MTLALYTHTCARHAGREAKRPPRGGRVGRSGLRRKPEWGFGVISVPWQTVRRHEQSGAGIAVWRVGAVNDSLKQNDKLLKSLHFALCPRVDTQSPSQP